MGKLGRNQSPTQSGALAKLELFGKQLMALGKNYDEFRQDILRAMRHTFTVVETRLSNIEDIMEAVVYLMGRETVEKKVQELHIEKLESRSAADKTALEMALKEERVVPSEVVGEASIVVGSEVGKDGTPLHPLRVQQLWQAVQNAEMKAALLGKKPGDVIETSIGTKFTINEVYDITMKAKVEAADAKPAEVPVEETQAPELPAVDEAVEQQLVEDLEKAAKTDENPTS